MPFPVRTFSSKTSTDPRNVVEDAIDKRKDLIEERRWDAERDTVWAIYDGDEHIVHNKRNWDEALDLARRKEVKLAISNPCFEYWYLLHYQDHFGNLDRSRARHCLKAHIPDYEKADVLFPDPLQPLTQDAIDRARRLEKNGRGKALPPYDNPSTHVHKLVTLLLSLGAR